MTPTPHPHEPPQLRRLLALDASTQRVSVALGQWLTGPDSVPLNVQPGEPVGDVQREAPEMSPGSVHPPVHQPVQLLAQSTLPSGSAASAGLVPALRAVLDEVGWTWRDVNLWVMGRGPGAFTGLRTAAAVVQGLAYGANAHALGEPRGAAASVLPLDTLWAVAESARQALLATGWPPCTPLRVWACLDARMGEWYVAHYDYAQAGVPDAECTAGPWLVNPQEPWATEPLQPPAATVYAGPVFEPDVPAALGVPAGAVCVPAWPTGAALLGLAPVGVARGGCVAPADAQPLYVRDQVALTTAERQAARQQVAPESLE